MFHAHRGAWTSGATHKFLVCYKQVWSPEVEWGMYHVWLARLNLVYCEGGESQVYVIMTWEVSPGLWQWMHIQYGETGEGVQVCLLDFNWKGFQLHQFSFWGQTAKNCIVSFSKFYFYVNSPTLTWVTFIFGKIPNSDSSNFEFLQMSSFNSRNFDFFQKA